MKNKILLLCCMYLSAIHTVEAQIASAARNRVEPAAFLKNSLTKDDWFNNAVKQIDKLAFSFSKTAVYNQYSSNNKTHGVSFNVDKSGYRISSRKNKNANWQATVKLQNIGRGQIKWDSKEFISSQITNSGVSFNYTNFRVDYLNDATGLRQNFIIKTRPAGNEKLKVTLALDNDFSYHLNDGKTLVCQNSKSNKTAFFYDGLKVWDVNGKLLDACMQLNENTLSLVVNDKMAVYPITIDPLNHSPEWTTSAAAVDATFLNTTQLQTDAIYGYNVTGLGDVNGDGYDDIAIGAPSASCVVAGTTISGAGAVFIYFGSATGLSTMPDKILRASSPATNAYFGFSVAGGNVIGSSRNDIIIGAPGETYTTTAFGIGSPATVTAGKVYVFNGADIMTANPAAALCLYLKGPAYFSNGITGIQPSNIAINALFGFSVAATEDLDGDNLGEIIIGSPGYADVTLSADAIRTGAAFVFFSGNMVNNLPVKLAAPSAANLGVTPADLNGLLYGFSVDGLGDYNKDGYPDIIVGAPAGQAIAAGNLLAGSAYVFCGNGMGVNTNFSTQLTGGGSFSLPVANLFGYTVRGVKSAGDVRNGNVLVGSPNGTVLSNITNGLKLNTGMVQVFLSKSSLVQLQTSDQQISSSRGNSLLNILAGSGVTVSSLFGAAIDNMLDVNCDGINDIIIGEPLTSSVGIIGSTPVGGAVTIYTGNADGTFNTTPYWSLSNTSFDEGINAGSMLGYSVAGAKHVRGPLLGVRALVGAPGAMVDFSAGTLSLGNTMGNLYNLTASNNGLGTAMVFGFANCGVSYKADINFTLPNTTVPGNVSTNDIVPAGTAYGVPVADANNINGATITLLADGTYNFTSTTAGIFKYMVPVCLPAQTAPCTMEALVITVLAPSGSGNPIIANTDYGITIGNNTVVIKTLQNDNCNNPNCSLDIAGVVISKNPANGTASINTVTGDITYLANDGFVGNDTLIYTVCDKSSPVKCATAQQIITIIPLTALNQITATDDYLTGFQNTTLNGNVSANDVDPLPNTLIVAAQTITKDGVGVLNLKPDGSFAFVPQPSFIGPVNFPYTTCDNGSPAACSAATLYLLVNSAGSTLAISLTDFSSSVQHCSVNLKWSTTQEDDLKTFVIQHSNDSKNWMTLSSITARGNAGTANKYSFDDVAPFSGQNYYRLQLLSKQGIKTYTKTLLENVNCEAANLVLNPNPFQNKISIHLNSIKQEMVEIDLLSFEGKIVLTKNAVVKIGSNEITLNDIGLFPAGMYIVKVKTSEGILNQKIIKMSN